MYGKNKLENGKHNVMKTAGLDHIDLTVSDLERARKFYGDILGFELTMTPVEYPDGVHAGSYSFIVGGGEIGLITHRQTLPGDLFDERRIGLDHLSFKAPDEAALYELAEKLIQAGVETKGVEVYGPNGKKYVSFRDPDNIQLEYWLDTTE
jgi:glyoxylase I family protein